MKLSELGRGLKRLDCNPVRWRLGEGRSGGKRRMSNFELGWVVGLLEGEGCFYSAVVKSGKGKSLVTRIIVGMTDKDVLDRLASVCGGKVGGRPHRGHSQNRKPGKLVWSWNLYGKKAVMLMEAIQPHMGNRRSTKIASCVSAWKASVNVRYEKLKELGRTQER